jgi:L-lactate dehydrogenase
MRVDERSRQVFSPTSSKVTIVGAGRVGATFAYTLILRGLVGEIALIDLDQERARGEAMDLGHSAPLSSPVRVCAGGYEDCRDADIVMIAAGVAQRDGETRLDLLKRNAEVFEAVVPRVVESNPNSILLIATNPVDIMSYVAWKLSDLPAERVIGSGTVLDTARLRYLLSQHLGVDPRNIHSYVIGEHGDSEVAIWSRASVAGIPIDEYCRSVDCHLTEGFRTSVERDTRGAAQEIIERKGATYYAVAAALLRTSESILLDQRAVLPVSTLVPTDYGLGEIYLSLPCILGRHGVVRTLEIPLDDIEDKAIHRSAEILGETLAGMGYFV